LLKILIGYFLKIFYLMANRFYLPLVLLLIASFKISAQGMRGREVVKGTVNFMELAKYQEKHPERYQKRRVIKEAEQENENEEHEPIEVDPSMIHVRPNAAGKPTSGGGPLMPASSVPVDTFQGYQSAGTSIPPDTHGGVDATYCVNANNANIRVNTKALPHTTSYTVGCDAFWGSAVLGGSGYSSFDPRVHYDPYSGRWIIVAVSTNGSFTGARILIAASATGNPTGTWYKYGVNVYSATNGWLDFPNVGFNNKWIVVTGNYFTAAGSSTTAAWFAFNKANVYGNVSASYVGNTVSGFTLCPAQTYDPSESSMFLININSRGSGSTGGTLLLRKLTGVVGSPVISTCGSPSAGSLPTSVRKWSQNGAGGADFAPQAGTTTYKIQNNDDRINNCVFRNGKIWCSHTVFYPQGGPTHSSVMWWQVDSLGVPAQVGVIDDPAGVKFYAFPSIAVNTLNDALIGFSTFSGTTYASAAYSLHLHTDPLDSVRTPLIYRHGQKQYYRTFGGTQNRWGDYSATCWDPVADDFWTIQEGVPLYSGSISSSLWDTWWAHVQICPTPETPTLTTSTTPHCVGTTATFGVAPIAGATSYTWSFSPSPAPAGWSMGGGITTSMTTTVPTNTIVAGTGTVTVTVAASNSCGLGSVLSFVDTGATAPPGPTVDTVVPACVGSAVATYSATATGATSFSWTASGPGWSGISSTATFNPTVGTAAGTISVFAVNTCGTSPLTTFPVSLGTVPGAATAVTGPSGTICSGSTATYTTPAVPGATSYTWTITGTGWSGTSTTATVNATVGTGPGTITITPVNACGNGTPFTLPSVVPVITPSAAFTVSTHTVMPTVPVTVTYGGTVSATATYTWSFGGGVATPGTGAGPHSVTWASSGLKTVTLTVSDNGCTSAAFSDTVRVKPPVSVQQVPNPKFSANTVPNPNDGSFNIVFDRPVSGAVKVVIYDILGKAVYTNEFSSVSNNRLPISVTNLPPGNYAATIQADGVVVSRKLTIDK
jgi:hypothetical protein